MLYGTVACVVYYCRVIAILISLIPAAIVTYKSFATYVEWNDLDCRLDRIAAAFSGTGPPRTDPVGTSSHRSESSVWLRSVSSIWILIFFCCRFVFRLFDILIRICIVWSVICLPIRARYRWMVIDAIASYPIYIDDYSVDFFREIRDACDMRNRCSRLKVRDLIVRFVYFLAPRIF